MYLTTENLDEARAALDLEGGWLLDIGEGAYFVTDDEGTVTGMRTEDFVPACQRLQCWDETKLLQDDDGTPIGLVAEMEDRVVSFAVRRYDGEGGQSLATLEAPSTYFDTLDEARRFIRKQLGGKYYGIYEPPADYTDRITEQEGPILECWHESKNEGCGGYAIYRNEMTR